MNGDPGVFSPRGLAEGFWITAVITGLYNSCFQSVKAYKVFN